MTSRRNLCLEEKINLIKEKQSGLSQRQLIERFHISVGAVSNIQKRKAESKPTDVILDSNLSKQKSIFDYFRTVHAEFLTKLCSRVPIHSLPIPFSSVPS